MRTRAEIEAALTRLYGEVPGRAEGVLHVTAVAREGPRHVVLKIGPHAPKSATDELVLSAARARVDAIVVSGSVLRAEPELRYDPPSEPLAELFDASAPPWLCVMTRSGELPRDHPVWRSAVRPIVYTGRHAAPTVPAHVEIVREEDPSPRGAIRLLLRERGARSVSIEAGPRVAMPLYEPPVRVDELMLSVFEGELDPAARGGEFLGPAALEARMRRIGGPTAVDEPSGRWVFSRYRARRGTAEGSR